MSCSTLTCRDDRMATVWFSLNYFHCTCDDTDNSDGETCKELHDC
jgi:hypothetical protein